MNLPVPENWSVENAPTHGLITRKSESKRSWFLVSVALLAIAITSRIGMIAWPFLNDSGLYAYMGKTVASGGVLYRDFFETKLPSVGLITSAFWRLFGSWWPGYVLAQLTLSLLGAGMLHRMMRRHGRASQAWSTFLYAAVFSNFCWLVFTGFQLEPMQAFFETLAAAAAIEAIASDSFVDSFSVGLCAGVAGMLKPTGMFVAVAFLVVLFISRVHTRKTKLPGHFASVVLGIWVPAFVTTLYISRTGLWPYLPNVFTQIKHYANDTPVNSFAGIKLLIMSTVLGFPMLFRIIPGSHSHAHKNESRSEAGVTNLRTLAKWRPWRNRHLLYLVCAWLAVDLIGVILQRRMYLYHFMPLVPPLAILYGMMPKPAKPIQVAFGLLPIALLSLRWQGTSPMHLDRGSQHQAVSDYVVNHTNPADAVYQDQIGRLLIETDRNPGSRYGTFFYFINYDQAPLDFCNGIISDFEDRRPRYIIEPATASVSRQTIHEPILDVRPVRRENFLKAGKAYDEYLASHYQLETVIDGNNVYRRRGEMVNGATAQLPKD